VFFKTQIWGLGVLMNYKEIVRERIFAWTIFFLMRIIPQLALLLALLWVLKAPKAGWGWK
jgi:hypothetical protein